MTIRPIDHLNSSELELIADRPSERGPRGDFSDSEDSTDGDYVNLIRPRGNHCLVVGRTSAAKGLSSTGQHGEPRVVHDKAGYKARRIREGLELATRFRGMGHHIISISEVARHFQACLTQQ